MSDFVHLHLHSEYSLLDGACRVTEIPKEAKAAGQKAVAITDHGAMYGAVKFYKACIAEGIKPIIGCEVYLTAGSRFDKSKESGSNSHLVLLVKNRKGYENLIYLVSKAFTEGFYSKPRIDFELLHDHSDGLIALSGCLAGLIPQAILSENFELAENYAIQFESIFGKGNFYLEIQNHGIPEQILVLDGITELSEKTGIPMVATNDVHYLKKTDADSQAILLCIQTGNVISDGRPIGFDNDEFYFKSTSEMTVLFSKYKNAVLNTLTIADMCNFDFDFSKTFLPHFVCPNEKNGGEYLKELALIGLNKRHSAGLISFEGKFSKKDYTDRAESELSVIEQMGYSEYFLIVRDFVCKAKSMGITVGPGRGSGAGSLVAFLIGITDIDSLYYDLSFESFLNIDRVSMPDFDIDFADNRREEVIDYVKQKYGDDHVAQIVTFGTMSARAVVRDVGRAYGMAYSKVDKIAKLIPQEHNITLALSLEKKELREMYDTDKDVRTLIDTSMALEGMPRHASTHAAGVVITDNPVFDYVPLTVNSGNILTQFDMDTIAELGLLKFDFLGIRYLTVISDAERQIKEHYPDFSIENIPYDDTKTYRLICKGNTEGVFQLNSAGMRSKLVQIKPETFDDIIAVIALYRPGPMKAGAIDAYAENKKDRSKIKYPTPELANVLDSTYGCLVYQEQVAKIFRELGGYSFSRADNVRRAIKKKKSDVIESERLVFIEGAAGKGISNEAAKRIYSNIEGFAQYAFNKSHATAYAVVAYRTAYLKSNYMKEYYSALITSEMSSQSKVYEYTAELKKCGISVLPPDINYSSLGFKTEDNAIRFGLLAIINVGRPLAEFIVREREANGKYTSFDNFIRRCEQSDLNSRQYEMLVKSGALDSLGVNRSALLTMDEKVAEHKAATNSGLKGQLDIMSLFEDEGDVSEFCIPDIPELDLTKKLKFEKESIGLYLSDSLISRYSDHVSRLNCNKISDVKKSFSEENDNAFDGALTYADGKRIVIAGTVSARTNKNTRNGEPMCFATVDDGSGEIEVVVFPKIYEKIGYLLTKDTAVCVEGTVSLRDDDVSVLANKIFCLEENSANNYEKRSLTQMSNNILYLKVDDIQTPTYRNVRMLITRYPGETQIVFYSNKTRKYLKEEGLFCNACEELISALCVFLGDDCVVLKQK